mmetsp:Transcript_10839/g.34427  ORF Transcript_10839/g.34427 Transcript_10839/m.34427 type:complete len:363 (-) Transcript_10839:1967-3055(-)
MRLSSRMPSATQRPLLHDVRCSVGGRRECDLGATLVAHSLRCHQLTHSRVLRCARGPTSRSFHTVTYEHTAFPRGQRQLALLKKLSCISIIRILNAASERLIVSVGVGVCTVRPKQCLQVVTVVGARVVRQFRSTRRAAFAPRGTANRDARRVWGTATWRARWSVGTDQTGVEAQSSQRRHGRRTRRRKCFLSPGRHECTRHLGRVEIVGHTSPRTWRYVRRRLCSSEARDCRQPWHSAQLTSANRVAPNLIVVNSHLVWPSSARNLGRPTGTGLVNCRRPLPIHKCTGFSETSSCQSLPGRHHDRLIRLVDRRLGCLSRRLLLLLPLQLQLRPANRSITSDDSTGSDNRRCTKARPIITRV